MLPFHSLPWFLKFFFHLHRNTWENMIYLTLAFFSMFWWRILLKFFGNTSITYHPNHSHSPAWGFFQQTLIISALHPPFAKALSTFPFYVMVSYKSAPFSSQLISACSVQRSGLLVCNSWGPPNLKTKGMSHLPHSIRLEQRPIYVLSYIAVNNLSHISDFLQKCFENLI